MLTEICAEIRNYFSKENERHFGTFHIENGTIVPLLINPDCEYVRICGSRKNDGVHYLGDNTNDLVDEGDFEGAVWEMSPPPAFIALCEEIEAWQTKNGASDSIAMSPYNSESFGGYSYTKGGTNGSGAGSSWASAYAGRLNLYRKIRVV